MRKRYEAILEEEEKTPDLFMRDGWRYFQEFKGLIELGLGVDERNKLKQDSMVKPAIKEPKVVAKKRVRKWK